MHCTTDVKKKVCRLLVLLLLLILDLIVNVTGAVVTTETGTTEATRTKRQSENGGYDNDRFFLGFGQGYGGINGGFDEYCHDCRHCNGCGHAPNRNVLIEYDYVPK